MECCEGAILFGGSNHQWLVLSENPIPPYRHVVSINVPMLFSRPIQISLKGYRKTPEGAVFYLSAFTKQAWSSSFHRFWTIPRFLQLLMEALQTMKYWKQQTGVRTRLSNAFIIHLFTTLLSGKQFCQLRKTPLTCETEPSEIQLQNGQDHRVVARYSGLYEEGEVEHINGPTHPCLSNNWYVTYQ